MASHQIFVLNALDFFPHHKHYGHENLSFSWKSFQQIFFQGLGTLKSKVFTVVRKISPPLMYV